jgi:hypothetical protein
MVLLIQKFPTCGLSFKKEQLDFIINRRRHKNPKNKPKQDPSNPDKKNPNKDKKNNSGEARSRQSNPSKLHRKDVDRKLDELAKKEGETRRKISRNSGKKQEENASNKDW